MVQPGQEASRPSTHQTEVRIWIDWRHLVRGAVLLTPIEEIRWRHGPESAIGKLPFPGHHKADGVRVWQGLQDDAIHDGEYSRGCADRLRSDMGPHS
jgi:hypothetical protein